MNDYLWNKTGSDNEIERIETALKALAYRPVAPPELPAKQQAFNAPRPSFFRLGFSFATAFLAIIAVGSAWFLLRNTRPVDQQIAVKAAPELPVIAVLPKTGSAPAVTPKPEKKLAVYHPRKREAALRKPASKAVRPQTLVLTQEEADAYRQLMTALSITSANLRIVKDKLAGTE